MITLWHLSVSHYNEKVRWALDYKSVEHERKAVMPSGHMLIAAWLTRGSQVTFPVLDLDGEVVGDSTAIIAALERRYPEPPLYPSDPEERRRALELEDWFDEELGPAIRRFTFHTLAKDRERFGQIASRMVPPPLDRFPGAVGAYSRVFTAMRFGAGGAEKAEQAWKRVLEALDRLETELGGRDYLVGDRFSVADLTAASLFYPLVLPPEGPQYVGRVPEVYERVRAPLKERPGYRWVEEMFRRHRRGAGTEQQPSRQPLAAG